MTQWPRFSGAEQSVIAQRWNMQSQERDRLKEIAEDAARTIYEALNSELSQARTNLFDARLKSDIGGPELIVIGPHRVVRPEC
jgi:hypothetical protein